MPYKYKSHEKACIDKKGHVYFINAAGRLIGSNQLRKDCVKVINRKSVNAYRRERDRLRLSKLNKSSKSRKSNKRKTNKRKSKH